MNSTMASFMHYCKSRIDLRVLGLCLLLWLPCYSAHAEGIAVNRTEIRLADEGYVLAADYQIGLTFYVEQALIRGIALNFISEFKLTRSRWYWLDETVAKSEQSYKLSYNPLTRQYRIARGTLFQNFDSLEEALVVLGHQTSNGIPPELLNTKSNYIVSLVKKDPVYTAYTRLSLDVSQLPKPLQVNALAGDDWNLDSGAYTWELTPSAITSARVAAP